MTLNLSPFDLVVIALAACYWAYAVTKTHGAFHLFSRLRSKTTFGGLLECPICAAFWFGVVFYALTLTPLKPIVEISAAVGLACAIGFYTGYWQQ